MNAKSSRSLGLITAKKVLYVANVDESDLHGHGPLVDAVRKRAGAEGGGVVPVCGKLEAELAELEAADRADMLAEHGPQRAGPGGAGPRGVSAAGFAQLFHRRPQGNSRLDHSHRRHRARRPPASSTPTSSAASSAPRFTRWMT